MHKLYSSPDLPSISRSARCWLAAGLLTVLALPAAAVQRVVRIEAPLQAPAGSEVKVMVLASTDAGNGEQVGFFHLEYSVDSGKTWKGYIYEVNTGAKTTRVATIPVGTPGSKTLVRARIAFRGGSAGDVDYTGAPVKWKDTWEKWASPPAKIATITVTR